MLASAMQLMVGCLVTVTEISNFMKPCTAAHSPHHLPRHILCHAVRKCCAVPASTQNMLQPPSVKCLLSVSHVCPLVAVIELLQLQLH